MKKNLYLLIAPGEFWLKPDIQQIIKEHCLDKTWEKIVFFGGRDEPETVISSCFNGSLFSQRRFFLLKNASDYSPAELNKLSIGLSPGANNLIVIFYCRSLARKERESVWYKNFASIGQVIDKSYPEQPLLEEIIANSLRESGKNFTADVPEYLAERFIENADLLFGELKKIALSPYSLLSLPEIEKILASSGQGTLNDLSKAIMTYGYKEALAIINNLSFIGEEPLRMLECIYRVVRQLYRAKIKESRGLAAAEIFHQLKIYSFQQADFLSGLKKFTLPQLTNGLFFIWQTERKLKTTQISPAGLLEALVIRLFSKQYRQSVIPESLRFA